MAGYRVVDTDNMGGDYPNEKFVGPEHATIKEAVDAAAELNERHDTRMAPRYYKVVESGYVLLPGFTP